MSLSPVIATFVSGTRASRRRRRIVIAGIGLSPGKFQLSDVLSVLFISDAVCKVVLFGIGLSRLRRTSGCWLWIMAVIVLIHAPFLSESWCRHFGFPGRRLFEIHTRI